MVALAPETGGGFKIVRKAEWGESGVVPPSGHSLLPATNFCSKASWDWDESQPGRAPLVVVVHAVGLAGP